MEAVSDPSLDSAALAAKIPKLRKEFETRYKDSIQDGSYHQKDLERLSASDVIAMGYLIHSDGDINAACSQIDQSLKYRKEFSLNELSESSFPEELHRCNGIYYGNKDKDGHQILTMKMKEFRNIKDSHLKKQFLGWWLDKFYLSRNDATQTILILIDLNGIGLGDVDLDGMKYTVMCFTTFFPAIMSLLIVYDMPWLLNAIWKVVRLMLSEEEEKYVKLLKGKAIKEYIDENNLPKHMGGKGGFKYNYEPGQNHGHPSV